MRKYVVLILVVLVGFKAPDNNSIRIQGVYTVAPKPGEKVYVTILKDAKTKQRDFIDSTIVKKGKFAFSFKALKPGRYELGNSGGQYFPIYLDYGLSDVFIDSSFARAKVRGNITDSLIKKYEQAGSSLSMLQLGAALMSMKYKNEGKEIPDSMMTTLREGLDKWTEVRKESGAEIGKRKDLAAAYVLANGAAGQFSTPELNDIYNGMPIHVKNAPYGLDFKNLLDKLNSLAVGVKAPAFSQKNTEGADVYLTDFVKGKKLVLIDFWASWCGPCRKENPNVVALYNKFKSNGFDIMGVSLDSKKDDWIKAIADDQLMWTQVSDLGGWKNSVATLYNVSAVPHTLLLDGNGVIVARNLRGKELEDKVEEICGKP